MQRRAHDLIDTLLGWAGFSLGYSEVEAPRLEARSPDTPAEPERRPVTLAEPSTPQIPVGRVSPVEDTSSNRDVHWTDLITLSTDRRLQVWHELENGLVERWELWTGRQVANLRARVDRPRERWQQLRQVWGPSRTNGASGTGVSGTMEQPEPRDVSGWSEERRLPIQRDRNTKLLERLSEDARERVRSNRQPSLATPTEERETDRLFEDAWAVDEPPAVATRETRPDDFDTLGTEDVQDRAQVVDRLQRMLQSDDAQPEDEGVWVESVSVPDQARTP